MAAMIGVNALRKAPAMTDKSEEARLRANARFEKTQKQSREGDVVRAQYEAAGTALRERTARLKTLRLAKEAAEAAELETSPPVKAVSPKVKKPAVAKKPIGKASGSRPARAALVTADAAAGDDEG
jgi:hypothetical protein